MINLGAMFLLYHISYNLCPILKRNWQTGTLYSETELMAALCVTCQTSDNAWPMASYFIGVCVCGGGGGGGGGGGTALLRAEM